MVGAGPGSPDLVTVRAARVLERAQVWLVDDLVSPEMTCYASPGTHVEWVGKRGGRCSVSQDRILQLTLMHAMAGKDVARVKGGDPLLFGRGGEEAAFLRGHGIAVEVVNGISSGTAAAQALGVALTHRAHCHGVSFRHRAHAGSWRPDWRALAGSGTTLVIYMGTEPPCGYPGRAARGGHAAGHARRRGDACRRLGGNGAGPVRLPYWKAPLATGLASPAVILVGKC
ncbi:uroporphyrinogen-III C-methyltransferase [Cupriavidus basilensis]